MSKGKELSTRSRALITVGAVVQFVLLGIAWLDLRKRAEAELRGTKKLWRKLIYINYAGPLAYLFIGRRRGNDG
jgi:hypothetical protein